MTPNASLGILELDDARPRLRQKIGEWRIFRGEGFTASDSEFANAIVS